MRWFIMALSCSILVLGGATMVALTFPPQPTTPEASVAAVLNKHAVAYVGVEVREGGCVPAPQYCQVYKAEVVVVGDREYVGRVECAQTWAQCRLWLAELDLRGVPLPPLAQEVPWIVQGRRAFENVRAALQR